MVGDGESGVVWRVEERGGLKGLELGFVSHEARTVEVNRAQATLAVLISLGAARGRKESSFRASRAQRC